MAVLSVGAAIALSAALVESTDARVEASQPWVVNDSVYGLALSGRTLYMAGRFTRVTPPTGPLLAVSASSGERVAAFPIPGWSAVYAIASDGAGGWFVGGRFGQIGGTACANLAHVTASMAVDPSFCPQPNAEVDSLLLDGSTLYVGGVFTKVGGASRTSLAALDAASGRASAWAPPAINGAVDGIAMRNGILYVLGAFNTVGGKRRFSLAAVEVATRKVTGWDPQAPGNQHGDPTTRSIAATANAIFVGGIFEEIGGKKRDALAALDPTTGKATNFVPSGQPWIVFALAAAGGRVYAGGVTESGAYLRAYDASTGEALPWRPQIGASFASDSSTERGVNALAVSGSTVYAGGVRLRAFDGVTGKVVSWTPPQPNQSVAALALSGATVIAGGTFTGAGGVMRDGLAAIDLRTGRPTSWNPRVQRRNGQPLAGAITLSGSTLYIAGDFDRVGGKPRAGLAAVDATSAKVGDWAPRIATDYPSALAASGSGIVLGGEGAASSYSTSGDTRWSLQTGSDVDSVNAIAIVGSNVYLGGRFTLIGRARRNALSAVSARTGSATRWLSNLGGEEVDALALSGSILYVGGQFGSVAGARRPSLAALHTASGKWTAWTPKMRDDDVFAIAVTAKAVYAGGLFGVRALDRRTGAALPWHPSLRIGGGASSVHAIVVVGSTVYVGDDAGLEVATR